ncbi:MAG: RIP metalloprotease RseP [Chitinophagaceae bacterium]|nr:RIP metalloprotease RseP [Chitinophagaceae bacterium]
MGVLIMVGQLILGLTILVGIHELGHLVAARVFGMRVEKYFIGFPPKVWSKKVGETEYGIGSIPFGGFVKISGMVDESMDTQFASLPPEPWEYRSKPAWQRLIVIMGGIIVNIIFGIAVFCVMAYINGETYLSVSEVNKNGGIHALELGKKVGFQTGDKILTVNGKEAQKFDEVMNLSLFLEEGVYFTVERNGSPIDIQIPDTFLEDLTNKKEMGFIEPRIPLIISEITKGSPADSAGLQAGDNIITINNTPIRYFDEITPILQENTSQIIQVLIKRKEQEMLLPIRVNEEGRIGFTPKNTLRYEEIQYGAFTSVEKGTMRAFNLLYLQSKGMYKLITGQIPATKSISGPIGMAKIFGSTWDWERFWTVTGILSLVLGFMNFLPIPGLDGGYALFLVYEIVTGRTVSSKVLEYSIRVGFVILISLMLFAIVNDIINLF